MAEGTRIAAQAASTTATTATACAALLAQVGQEVHVSDWLLVTQQRVDAFAEATGDHQWIHVDPARASRESPYGGPIAHGYLTLSLHILLRGLVSAERPYAPGVVGIVNYGLDKLRFSNAVRVGARIRGRFVLLGATVVAPNVLQVSERYTVEIEGESKPGCVAESIFRLIFAAS
ncbi:MAG: MaoC family dehydratase [Sinobacteraceae bacterium]|nr:MaoC family dehydratase [Nevskiaceae bacterium]